ncbi:complexed with cef1p [Characodon lateralis]|uniref:Complexed with cef1p n=1 Tax=Characodon lateralis TaxID=208331 RepID=A0ABU7E4U9_9TELE|nr:complexed with cef1p [Characodon lateralis]
MTTAARPTFEPARGGRGKGEGDLSALSKQYSSRDLPGHTKIKYRQPTQDAPEEVRARDFRRELEERERVTARDKTRERGPREHTTSSSSSSSSSSKRPRLDQIPAANLDADDPLTDVSTNKGWVIWTLKFIMMFCNIYCKRNDKSILNSDIDFWK